MLKIKMKMLYVNTGTKDSARRKTVPMFTEKKTVKLTYLVKCVKINLAKKGTEKLVDTGTRTAVLEKMTVLTFTEKPGNPERCIKELQKELLVDTVVVRERNENPEADTEVRVKRAVLVEMGVVAKKEAKKEAEEVNIGEEVQAVVKGAMQMIPSVEMIKEPEKMKEK